MIRCLMFMLAFLSTSLFAEAAQPVEFVIVVTSYNNGSTDGNRCLKNLESIRQQTYPYFTVQYVDDCSTDNNGALVDEFVAKNGLQDKFTIIHNAKRQGKLKNQYEVINKLDPHKVIIDLDGDDELAHQKVLEKLAAVYADENIWLTWGSYRATRGMKCICAPFPESIIQTMGFRSYPWVTSHLKTFYAGLFQLIKIEDLQFQGKFIPQAADLAIMYPMLEMAAKNHFQYIKDILYIFYVAPHSYFGVNPKEKIIWREIVINNTPYSPLNKLF